MNEIRPGAKNFSNSQGKPVLARLHGLPQFDFGHVEEFAPGVVLGLLDRGVAFTIIHHRIRITAEAFGGEVHQAFGFFERRNHLASSEPLSTGHIPNLPKLLRQRAGAR